MACRSDRIRNIPYSPKNKSLIWHIYRVGAGHQIDLKVEAEKKEVYSVPTITMRQGCQIVSRYTMGVASTFNPKG
jgi:hypothetical protein